MTFARALRLLLALLLLGAQHAALSHRVAHAGNRELPPAERQFCDLHEALGTVAGALDGPAAPVPAAPFAPDSAALAVELPAASLPGLAPSSRGPPPLL